MAISPSTNRPARPSGFPSSTTPRPDTQLSNDPVLQPFLSPSFSPIDYLNSSLPAWTPSSSSTTSGNQTQEAKVSTLADLTTHSQTLLSTLDAKLSLLSTRLTSLTDEILRTGGRLTYEIEILHSDINALVESLCGAALEGPLSRFSGDATGSITSPVSSRHMNGGSNSPIGERKRRKSSVDQQQQKKKNIEDVRHEDENETQTDTTKTGAVTSNSTSTSEEEEALKNLHILTTSRERLTSVTRVFDNAMAWHLRPSALSLKNQFVSNSSSDDVEELESKAKEWEVRVREEVETLIEGGEVDDVKIARDRVRELRDLVGVWRGTVEEKARGKVVESLEKIVGQADDGDA